MKASKFLMSAAATAGLAATASAQFPAFAGTSSAAPPIATAPAFPASTGIAPQAAVPDGPTIWSKLGVSQAQREFCRRKLCNTPFGRLMNTIQNPISNVSGGLIPPFCPGTPTLAELMDPGVIGAAAKVKQDRAGAAQRIEAIRLLATVDCSYWPEAEETLIGALRTDRNECVRYEAALALGRGCCCTAKVIVALSHTVCCSDKDGGFMEKSVRVRAAAAAALERCLTMTCCGPELPPITPDNGGGQNKDDGDGPEGGKKKKDGTNPTGDGKTSATTASRSVAPATAKPGPGMKDSAEPMSFKDYYSMVPRVPRDQVYANARRALEIGRRIGTAVSEEVIAADYSAAGFTPPGEARKPSNLWAVLSGPTAEMSPAPVTTATASVPTLPAAKTTATAVPMELPKAVATKPALPSAPPAAAANPVGVAKVGAKAPALLPPVPTETKVETKVPPLPVMPVTPAKAVTPAPVPTPAPATAPVTVPTPVAQPKLPPVMAAPRSSVPADPVPLTSVPRTTWGAAPPQMANPYGYR